VFELVNLLLLLLTKLSPLLLLLLLYLLPEQLAGLTRDCLRDLLDLGLLGQGARGASAGGQLGRKEMFGRGGGGEGRGVVAGQGRLQPQELIQRR